MHILIIEDDTTLNKNINEALIAEKFTTTYVYDGLLAERILKKEVFDCVIMDINLPGKNGFDLCKEYRYTNTHTPVIMLTAFSEIDDKVFGFDCGADDYLTKPFFMKELILRVHALIKRSKFNYLTDTENNMLVTGDITLNKSTKKVTREGVAIELTPREFQILSVLMEKKGEKVSKSELIKEIWGKTFDANTNTIEVYINFLRNKIDKPYGKNSLKTKVGFGYYLENK